MKLLDRYLLREFARTLTLVLVVLAAIYLLVDFFERIDDFINAGKPMTLATRYFLLKLPLMVEQLLPVCLLLGAVLTMGLLNHHGELTSLKAGGIRLTRIAAPLIGAALFFTLAGLAWGQWVLPPAAAITNRILHEEVGGNIPKGIIRQGRHFFSGREGIYSFIRPDPAGHTYLRFSYAAWDGELRLDRLLHAATATWREGRWHLTGVEIKQRNERGDFTISTQPRLDLTLPDSPADFFLPEYTIDEMSLTELYRAAKGYGGGIAPAAARLKLHEKLSYLFLGLPLLLLGMPVVLLVHRRWGHDLSVGVPMSCGLAFAAWGGWAALQALVRAGHMPPLAGALTVHVLAASLGTYLLLLQDR